MYCNLWVPDNHKAGRRGKNWSNSYEAEIMGSGMRALENEQIGAVHSAAKAVFHFVSGAIYTFFSFPHMVLNTFFLVPVCP
jgi:hypothetical protein